MESCKPTQKALTSCMKQMLGQSMSKKVTQRLLQWITQKTTATTLTYAEVAELWRRGSVVGSWLLDLTADVLRNSGELGSFDGGVSDSGEGRWTVHAAVDLGVPTPVISTALFERFGSRKLGDFANRVLNGMRYMFGGHDVR